MQTDLNAFSYISVIPEEKMMPNSKGKKRLKIEDPATYRISVQGYLEDVWSDRLANMTITNDIREEQAPVSTLTGRVRDQAELVGVLNGLYELRMPILSMEIMNDAELSKL